MTNKDTVWLPLGEPVRLIIRFTDDASDEYPYMYHCHMLRCGIRLPDRPYLR